MTTAVTCNQCNQRPAVHLVGGNPICVDCGLKLAQTENLRFNQAVATINFLEESMNFAVGLPPGLGPRMRVPTPVVHQGPAVLNQLHIDRSNIGVLNTGTIAKLIYSTRHLADAGADQLAAGIKALTEAVANATEIEATRRDEMLDQLLFLSGQALTEKEKRQPGVIRATFKALKEGVGLAAGLAELLVKVAPLLKGALPVTD